ncbi:MAG: GNAT family N-acetyltransferase [Clostridia bacterium]
MIKYLEKTPTAEDFNYLTNSVGWGTRENSIVEEALKNTLYSLCVYDDNKLIGYGRIIGDKTIFLYIQDIMVVPEYQKKHIGTGIMENLLKQINEYKKINSNIRVYLGASKRKETFYEKFGFISRAKADLGEGMILME